ncbi:MAG: hypothetical protein ACRDHZ_12970, partial [Ktedonobacteraceae bacterium]
MLEEQRTTPALFTPPSTLYNVQKSDMCASPSSEERENLSLHVTCHGELFHPTPFSSSGMRSEQPSAVWFLLKQQAIQALVVQWNGRAMYCDELQGIVDLELRMFDLVKSLYHQDTYAVSRRSVLTALACLPLTLLASSPQKL